MHRILCVVILGVAAACASNSGMEIVNARPMDGGNANDIAWGDCAEARRRAADKPDLDVDSVPRVVTQKPTPFLNMPPNVRAQINAKGSSVKVNVLVDTLGRPDMKTFQVVETSHPWLAENLKSVMPAWRFRAARLAGCKVPRVYKFSATSKPRAR